jgi:hypothetical protein
MGSCRHHESNSSMCRREDARVSKSICSRTVFYIVFGGVHRRTMAGVAGTWEESGLLKQTAHVDTPISTFKATRSKFHGYHSNKTRNFQNA